MSAIDELTSLTRDYAYDWIEDRYNEYDYFDYLWDDLEMEVSGNDSGRCPFHDDDIARNIIWNDDFQRYLDEMETHMGYIVQKGEETVMVYAVYFILDMFLYGELENHYLELVGEEE